MFLERNPTYTIINSYTGEGWEGVANHHFEYKKPNDERIYKEVWTFVQQDNGTWKVTGQWTPKEQTQVKNLFDKHGSEQYGQACNIALVP